MGFKTPYGIMKRLIQKWLGVIPPDSLMESVQLLHKKIDDIFLVLSEPRQVPYESADIKYIHDVLTDIMHLLQKTNGIEPKKKGRPKKK